MKDRRKTSVLFSCAAGAVVVIGSYLYWEEHRTGAPARPGPPPPQAMHMLHRPVSRMAQGVRLPPTVAASQARLADQDEVIGVTVEDRYRAYALSAFNLRTRQVVNDVVGDVPVTVTYCIDAKRHRVFTGGKRAWPLNVMLAPGRNDILLGIDGNFYSQQSLHAVKEEMPPFPLEELKVSRMSWKAWRTLHPDTDVYVGLPESYRFNPPPPPGE